MEDFDSKYSGEQVEALLDQVASGNAGGGGGGGITEEKDPVFSNSPAATITEEKIAEWDGAADLVAGHDTDISQLFNDIGGKQDVISDLEAIRDGASKGATALQEHQSLKTINGESIVGSGDITIAGGSSGSGGVETIFLSGGWGSPLIIEEMLAEKRYYLYVDGNLDGNEESIVIAGFEGDGVVDGAHIRHFYAVIECVSADGAPLNVSLSLPDVVIRWSTGTPIPIRGDGRYELSITQVSESGFAYYNAVLTSFSYL